MSWQQKIKACPKLPLAFLGVAAVFAVRIWDTQFLTKAFPMMALGLIAVSAIALILSFIKRRSQIKENDIFHGLMVMVAFFAIAFIYFEVGFLTTTLIFTALFIKLVAKESWLKAIIISGSLLVFLITLGQLMAIEYPSGLLDPYINDMVKTLL